MRRLLKPHSDVEIIAEAATAAEAQAIVEQESPDLLFLDIQMPEQTVLTFCAFCIRHGLLSSSRRLLMNLPFALSRSTLATIC